MSRNDKVPYTPNPQHRNQAYAYQKSQWSISLADEQRCYQTATAHNWLHNNAYWGLHIAQGQQNLAPLGVPPQPIIADLHIAKFVCNQGNWHGYPVAHWMSPFDKPGENVVTDWHQNGHITRQAKSKIMRGKKCNL